LGAIASWAVVSTMGACTDLFHSTNDIRTACAIDASIPGCSMDAGAEADGSVDFCAWSSTEAKARATRACAWLGACAGPLGGNAFGACTLQARLAFDCAANPDHPTRGSVHDRWACLAASSTCEAVRLCVLPESIRCDVPGDYIECATDGGDRRVECVATDASARVEDCSLWGETCVPNGNHAFCGPSGAPVDCSDAGGACYVPPRSSIRWCPADGGQIGIDCGGNGAQVCGAYYDDAGGAWPACVPQADAATACAASRSVRCVNGVAHTCPAGLAESIDCASILDSPDACGGTTLSPPFDWTSACAVEATCPADSCDGSVLTGCARGATFRVDCSDAGLGACSLVATDQDAAMRAACAPP
jgi:hypothetical protein